MCGLVAVVARPGRGFSAEALQKAGELLHHRGPDGDGRAVWPVSTETPGCLRIGLAHTRLAILDLRHHANQPMHHSSGTLHMVYNGEIYNYRELRTELRRLGHDFVTSGDTEVLLAAYAEWGAECVRRLRGMYAFVIVDEGRQSVFAARDPYGIKPLYFSEVNDGWILASEIKSILAFPEVPREVDTSVLLRHVRFGVAAHQDQSIFRDIKQLLPGHRIVFDLANGQTCIRRQYRLAPMVLTEFDIGFQEAADELRERFLDSVTMHLRSDVPVGTALSGGIDSSAVLCAMRHALGPEDHVNAFTFTSPGSPLDESSWARIVADRTQAKLHLIRLSGRDLIEELTGLARLWDSPLAGTSAYAQFRVFKEVRNAGVKVMLDGQGADETLGGYLRYISARVASLLRRGDAVGALRLIRRAKQHGVSVPVTLAEAADCLLPPSLHHFGRRVVGRSLVPAWVDAHWFDARGATLAPVHSTRAREVLRDQLISDLQQNLLPHLLRYEDTNSMLWSIESRVPFLDPAVTEFCLSLPEKYLVADDGTTKAVFRRAMRGLVPDEILDRRDKIGFEAPRQDWLGQAGGDQFEDLGKSTLSALPFLDAQEFHKLWSQSRHHRRVAEAAWRLIFLAEWSRAHNVTFS